jgi:hypothetical protein
MTVIRPDREGSNKAHVSLNVPKRPRGSDPAEDAAEASRAEGRHQVARDGSIHGGENELASAARLTNLLHRAGIGSENLVTVRSASTQAASPNARGAQAVTNDSIVKAPNKVDELQLGPVQAPRIDLNQRLSESARSFATNLDKAITNHLVQFSSALSSQQIHLDRNAPVNLTRHDTGAQQHDDAQRQVLTPAQARAQANENVLARIIPERANQLEAVTQDRGLQHLVDLPANEADEAREADIGDHGVNTGNGTGNGVGTAHGILTAPVNHANEANVTNKGKAKGDTHLITDVTAGMQQKTRGGGNVNNAMQLSERLTLLDMSNLSSDQLLAEFLKLNINDPNANVQTQDKLYTLASEMRKQAIEEAKKRIERAQELMKEAQKYADQVQKYADMAGMVGIFAAFLGPLGAIISGIMQIVVAIAQYTAQMKMLDAKEEKNNAERFKLMGDMHQDQVHETAEVINTIMELKNQMIESVIAMLNASFSTRQQLMSAAMAR